MGRFAAVVVMGLLAGCAAGPEKQADRGHSACPSRHTLACDVSARTREIIPGTCSCVRNSDVNAIIFSPAFGAGRTFRSRIR